MRHLNKTIRRTILLLLALLAVLPVKAADGSGWRRGIYTTEDSGAPPAVELEGSAELEGRLVCRGAAFTTGSSGIALIKKYEGFRESPYSDSGTLWIGYGSLYELAEKLFGDSGRRDENNYLVITEAQATQMIQAELEEVEPLLNAYLDRKNISINQNQFDALASFTYNIGIGWTSESSMNSDGTPYKLRALLEGSASDWTEAKVQEAFAGWCTQNGTVLEGLAHRRAEEAKLFMTPYTQADNRLFLDVPEDAWYGPYVAEAYEKGIMNGTGGGYFQPEANMTRAEMVQALANYAGADLTPYQGQSQFSDVAADAWYAPAVAWAARLGIVNGIGGGMFAPEQPIERAHICNIVARFLRGSGVPAGTTVEPFLDDEEIEPSAMENVYYCASLKLIEGVGGNRFEPTKMAERGQVTKILVCMSRLS